MSTQFSALGVRYLSFALPLIAALLLVGCHDDDDDHHSASVSIADATSIEGDDGLVPMLFTISLSEAASRDISGDWAAESDTAIAPEDFVAANGIFTIAKGQMSTTVSVNVVGDTEYESHESFTVSLSNVSNALIAVGSATGLITDDESLRTGLLPIRSGGVDREYYLQLPAGYTDGAAIQAAALGDDLRPPLLFAYHGYTGSYANWVGENHFYDLVDVVGDQAIMVVPNGLQDAAGKRVWGGDKDLEFFRDIIAELEQRSLQYNPNKVFVAGHSNGAGFTHELGCAFGDVIRAIVTAAGALTSTDCVGSVAVFLMQGNNDPLTNAGLARGSLKYWTLYNGWDPDAFVPAFGGLCADYSFPGELNSPYPVLWCEHTQGHSWPDFGSQTAWDFLAGLDEVEPTPEPPYGGGAEVATPPKDADLYVSFQVPDEINRPLRGAVTLRPLSFIDNPTCSAPDVILGLFSADGVLIPGQLSDQLVIPITYLDFAGGFVFPAEKALSITIYVEGGGTSVIPTPGVDYDVNIPVSLVSRELDLVIDEPLELTPVADLCGF